MNPNEFILASSSGLGQNRVTPRSMMKLLRALKEDLSRYNMTYADIMPVAGVDRGTLEGRFDSDFARGSVVGKTGTLRRTDNGVSTLMRRDPNQEKESFFSLYSINKEVSAVSVIFKTHLFLWFKEQMGGAAPMDYKHIPIDIRLATSRISLSERKYERLED